MITAFLANYLPSPSALVEWAISRDGATFILGSGLLATAWTNYLNGKRARIALEEKWNQEQREHISQLLPPLASHVKSHLSMLRGARGGLEAAKKWRHTQMEFEEEHLRSILHIHEPVISLAIANLVELVHDTIDENVEDNLPQNATVPDLVKADDRLQPTVTEISMFEEAVRIAAKLRLASPGNKVESMWEKLVPNKVQARASKWFAAQVSAAVEM